MLVQHQPQPPNNVSLRQETGGTLSESQNQNQTDVANNNNDEPLVALNLNVLERSQIPDPNSHPHPLLSEFDAVSSLDNLKSGRYASFAISTPTTNTATTTTSIVHSQSISHKLSDAYLSSAGRDMMHMHKVSKGPVSAPNTPEALRRAMRDKKDKMEYNQLMMMRSLNEKESRPLSYHGRSGSLSLCLDHPPSVVNKRHIVSSGGRSRKESLLLNRRSMPSPYLENRIRDKFDVSELDTNLPRIDLDAIEVHLKQARDEERKRRSDREEIRRRLALEADGGEHMDKPRKHNLHSRLQSSMNLQICFMNETASDSESPNSDAEGTQRQQPHNLSCAPSKASDNPPASSSSKEESFFAKQARLQAQARQALAQAKEVARIQLNQEREGRAHSPITEMIRNSLEKVGVGMPQDRRRVSRQLLTEMNVTQLQVIVNDLHSHIEKLNEKLVSMLLERDDLHMEQDSMLVDIEDLTRYLAAKNSTPDQTLPLISASQGILGKK